MPLLLSQRHGNDVAPSDVSSTSTTGRGFPGAIASVGPSHTHAPQVMHRSTISTAIGHGTSGSTLARPRSPIDEPFGVPGEHAPVLLGKAAASRVAMGSTVPGGRVEAVDLAAGGLAHDGVAVDHVPEHLRHPAYPHRRRGP